MRIVVVCNRFNSYRSDGVYHACEIATYVVEVCWTLDQAVWAAQRMDKKHVMFLKVDGEDLYVSTESRKAHLLV